MTAVDEAVQSTSNGTEPADAEAAAKAQRQQRLTRAYNTANSRLREAHLDEFNGYYQEEAAALGEKWEPKLSPEQKAKRELERLLAEHPNLRAELNPQAASSTVESVS